MSASDLYLDLLKRCLTDSFSEEEYYPAPLPRDFWKHRFTRFVVRFLREKNIRFMKRQAIDPKARSEGMDWPVRAETMIGRRRLDHLQRCIERVLLGNVAGDLIETGVWRGGAAIFMRGVLKANGVTDRSVWAADTYEGTPPPDVERFPADKGDLFHAHPYLRVSLEEVQRNFERYSLLDGQVHFLKGRFRDTLPSAPVDRLAILRIDGDTYEATMDSLTHLYPKLSRGGYVIIDDFYRWACRKAAMDFREANQINDEVTWIDRMGAFWIRT